MEKIVEIVKELRNASGSNDKLAILKREKNNKELESVLHYTYDPFMKYKISEPVPVYNKTFFVSIFDLLDTLSRSNINNELRDSVSGFLYGIKNEDILDLYTCMIKKDLRCGISATTINKVWKGLIPQFNVQLAKKYEDCEHKINGSFTITQKFDGIRCIIVCHEDGEIELFTRQGKLIEGCNELKGELAKLKPEGFVLDGELLALNPDGLPSDELYRKTKKITGLKGEKSGLEFHLFDLLPIDEFKDGISERKYSDRRRAIYMIDSEIKNKGLTFIKAAKVLYNGSDKDKIKECLAQAIENGQEGVMLNMNNSRYMCKRTDGLLKCKVFNDCDLEIIGFEEGNGKFEGTTGSIICNYKGYKLGVGTGLSDEVRDYLWNHREELVGRIVKVKYFEESKNEQGELSLRFPSFLELRELGKEVSYN